MIMVAYYFSLDDGVGAKRSRFLYEMLLKRHITVDVIHKNKWNEKTSNSRLKWLLKCVCFLFNSRKQVVYISCGPFWHLFFVTFIAFIKRHHLFVDFRDPWSLNIKKEPRGIRRLLRLAIAVTIERFVYAVAERFIVCTPGMLDLYAKLFNDRKKLMLALNGHELDENLLEEHDNIVVSPYKIVCLGKFLSYGQVYLKKYEALCAKLDELKVDYKIFFVGADKETVMALSKDSRAAILPNMPYKKAIVFLSDAHFALLSIRDEDFEFGTKVFDYIAMGIPIYDWFDHEKSFYQFFSKYLNEDIHSISRLNFDSASGFYRGNCLKQLCDFIEKESGG